MNEAIMNLSNSLVYEGELLVASQKEKNRVLSLPTDWVEKVAQPFAEVIDPQYPIRFINYDYVIDSFEKSSQNKERKIRRVIEVELCCHLFNILTGLGVPQRQIAIISAYNASVARIARLLKQSGTLLENHGNILTIDRSQGIDKQIIILLVEKGNDELIENPRRLNVALTRAKSKLIVIGSEVYLERMKVFKGNLAKLLKQDQVDLTKMMIVDVLVAFQKKADSQSQLQGQSDKTKPK